MRKDLWLYSTVFQRRFKPQLRIFLLIELNWLADTKNELLWTWRILEQLCILWHLHPYLHKRLLIESLTACPIQFLPSQRAYEPYKEKRGFRKGNFSASHLTPVHFQVAIGRGSELPSSSSSAALIHQPSSPQWLPSPLHASLGVNHYSQVDLEDHLHRLHNCLHRLHFTSLPPTNSSSPSLFSDLSHDSMLCQ